MYKSFVKSLLILSLTFAALSSCEKDTFTTNENLTNRSETSFFRTAGSSDPGSPGDTTNIDCFDFIYPITILMPDESAIEVNSMDELENLIDQWFEENPYQEEEPTFQLPVTVVLEDGSEQVITEEEELCYLFEECDDYDEEECYAIIFPVDLRLPDGKILTINSEDELDEAWDEWENTAGPDAEEYPDFVYPIQVAFEDGSMKELSDPEELEELDDWCYDEDYEDYEDYDDCFEIVFPVDIELPDGGIETADNEEELCIILAGWEATADPDDDEYPDFVYPIEVLLEDDSELIIYNTQEFEELEDECYDEYDDYELCFDINFPIQVLLPDSTIITGESEETLFEQLDQWYEENPDEEEEPALIYPVSVTLEDNTVVELNSEEELDDLLDECFDDEDFGFNQIYATQGNSKALLKEGKRLQQIKVKRN